MSFEINPLIKEFWNVKEWQLYTFHIGGQLYKTQYMRVVDGDYLVIADADCYKLTFSNVIKYINIRYYYKGATPYPYSYSEEDMLKLIKLKAFI